MLTVYGRANSINVQKVMWLVGELDLDVTRLDVGGPFGGNDTPEYLAMNPNGRVPTLKDDEFILWESNSIVRYLAEHYGREPWWSEDKNLRALANQWMDWYISTMHPHMTIIFQALVRQKPEDRDMKAVNKAKQDAARLWALVDKHLVGRDFLTGDKPTMADIPLGTSAYRWFNMDIDRPELKNVEAWYDRLRERDAYSNNVMLPLT